MRRADGVWTYRLRALDGIFLLFHGCCGETERPRETSTDEQKRHTNRGGHETKHREGQTQKKGVSVGTCNSGFCRRGEGLGFRV